MENEPRDEQEDLSKTHQTIMFNHNEVDAAEEKLRDLCVNGKDKEDRFKSRISRLKTRVKSQKTKIHHKRKD